MQMDALWGPWALVSLVSVLFVVMVLVGRQQWHPWAVLAVEAVVAAVLAFVPPWQWLLWFRLGGWSGAMVGGPVQPLAVCGWVWWPFGASTSLAMPRRPPHSAPMEVPTHRTSGEGGRVVSS